MVTMSDNPTSSAIPFEQFTDNNGTDYMVNVALKMQTNLMTGECREIKSVCVLTHRASDH